MIAGRYLSITNKLLIPKKPRSQSKNHLGWILSELWPIFLSVGHLAAILYFTNFVETYIRTFEKWNCLLAYWAWSIYLLLPLIINKELAFFTLPLLTESLTFWDHVIGVNPYSLSTLSHRIFYMHRGWLSLHMRPTFYVPIRRTRQQGVISVLPKDRSQWLQPGSLVQHATTTILITRMP